MKKLFFLLLLLSFNTQASQPEDEIKSIFRSMQSFLVKFSTAKSTGIIIVEKPYNMRINYDPPHPLLIVSNPKNLSIYDYDLDQITRLDTLKNPFLSLFCSDDMSDMILIDFDKTENKYTFVNPKLEQKFEIFIRDNLPYKINIMNSDDSLLQIDIAFIKNIKVLDKTIFKIKDNKVFGKPKRFSEDDLLKKISIIIK